MSSKKILFVSCSVGAGHVRAAEALLAYSRTHYPQIEVAHIDLVDYLAPLAKFFYFKSYSLMAKYAPWLWGAIYRATKSPIGAKRFNQLTWFSKKLGSSKFFQFIENYQPDYILCTHFTPADLIINHSQNFNITKKVGFLLTDYVTHSLHLASTREYFFVATPEIKKYLTALGAQPQNIIVSGIPIDQSFFQTKQLDQLQTSLNIDPAKPTVLFLSGGEGYAKIDETIQSLLNSKKPLNIVAIAGKNKQLFNRLKELDANLPINYQVKSWVNNIDEYMRVADIIVTKPGGMTITECLHQKKPMIIVDPVPGQEEDNLLYLKKNSLGTELKKPADLPDLIDQILHNPHMIAPDHTHNSSQVILNHIINHLS